MVLSIKQCSYNDYLMLIPEEWEERSIKNYLAEKYNTYRQRVQLKYTVHKFKKKKQKLVRVKVIGNLELNNMDKGLSCI